MAIGVARSLTFRDKTQDVPELLREALELVFVQIVHEAFEVYALGVYLADYRTQKRYLPQLQQWVVELRAKKPSAVFLIAGDFNTSQCPLKYLYELTPKVDSEGRTTTTFRREVLGELRHSRTDWLLCSHQAQHETLLHWTTLSDHCAIECTLQLPRAQPKATHILLPQADVIREMCLRAEIQASDIFSFLQAVKEQARKTSPFKKIRAKLK